MVSKEYTLESGSPTTWTRLSRLACYETGPDSQNKTVVLREVITLADVLHPIALRLFPKRKNSIFRLPYYP